MSIQRVPGEMAPPASSPHSTMRLPEMRTAQGRTSPSGSRTLPPTRAVACARASSGPFVVVSVPLASGASPSSARIRRPRIEEDLAHDLAPGDRAMCLRRLGQRIGGSEHRLQPSRRGELEQLGEGACDVLRVVKEVEKPEAYERARADQESAAFNVGCPTRR